MTLCRHCHQHPIHRPRGLCWACWHDLAIREQYPPATGKRWTASSIRDFNGRAGTPGITRALPRTPRKVLVLARRARLRQALHHPKDARWED